MATDVAEHTGLSSSEQTNEIIKALVKLQGSMPPIPKDQVMEVRGRPKPHHYASLESILSAIRKPMADAELAIIQPPVFNGSMKLITRLVHASGQWIEATYPLADASSLPHAMGSAITYGRRYSVCGLLGIAPEDDDDGETAQAHQPHQQNRQPFDGNRVQSPPQQQLAPQQQQPAAPAANASAPASNGPAGSHIVQAVTSKSGQRGDKTWTLYTIKTDLGEYKTFSGAFADKAKALQASGKPCLIRAIEKKNGNYTNYELEAIDECEPPAAPVAQPASPAAEPSRETVRVDGTITAIEGPRKQGGMEWFKVITAEWGEFVTYVPAVVNELQECRRHESKAAFHYYETSGGRRVITKVDEGPF